jgi:hypothetical protein
MPVLKNQMPIFKNQNSDYNLQFGNLSTHVKVSRSRHLRFIIAFVLVSTLVIQPDDGLQQGRNM